MLKIFLKQSFARKPPVPSGKNKTQYFDTKVSGLVLEVRSSGGEKTGTLCCRFIRLNKFLVNDSAVNIFTLRA